MTVYLVAIIAAMAAFLGGLTYGTSIGENRALAKQATIEKVAELSAKAVANQSADAISQLKVIKSTVIQKATHEIRTNPVYADCKHSDSMLNTVNSALTGLPDTIDEVKLPGTDTVSGTGIRPNNGQAPGGGFHLSGVPGFNWLGSKK